ncbi:MAG: phosphoribosylanthranilate isomerase [Bacteroidales bacterium]|jgi:phosphoribosylanthranilate isomerase|nr:phosphoribosylanthranilate isomerase [Bacteroidales bacterium]
MMIKVCGMRAPENICALETVDIDIVGFVFYPASPRYVADGVEAVAGVGKDGSGKKKAGVFVNETPERLRDRARRFRLDYIQLHGNESPAACEAVRRQGYSVIKAFPIADGADFRRTENYAHCADYFLFDTKCANHGGSGRRFDWSLLDEYRGDTPFLLSGGLTPDCADDIRRLHHPAFAGIDLNSGFETSPAVKDIAKLRDFIRQIRSLDASVSYGF